MKKIFLILPLISIVFGSALADMRKFDGYSRYVAKSLSKLDFDKNKESALAKAKEDFAVFSRKGKIYIGAFVLPTDDADPANFERNGFNVVSSDESVWMIECPVGKIFELSDRSDVKRIELSRKVAPLLDAAKEEAGWNRIYEAGSQIDGYDGSGVIVGVVDQGFDFTHPAFYSGDGRSYRISRCWAMNSSQGNPPSGYDFGVELVGANQLVNFGATNDEESHGTHVASTAAGGGFIDGAVSPTLFSGLAPESEIVLADVSGDYSNSYAIANGIEYIFDYAESVGKPCVVNLSMGGSYGSRDGNSLQDNLLEDLVGPGKIIVKAAGNSGDVKGHAETALSGESFFTFVYFDESTEPNYGDGVFIEIYGDDGAEFEVQATLYSFDDNVPGGRNKNHVAWTKFYSPKRNDSWDTTYFQSSGELVNASFFGSDAGSDLNYQNMELTLNNPFYDAMLGLEVICKRGKAHLWIKEPGSFSNKLPDGTIVPRYVDGDYSYSIAENADHFITVGAYTTKNMYYDYENFLHEAEFYAEIGELAPFSSKGPTRDGRIKPDICAPGNVVVAAYNSFDQTFDPAKITFFAQDGIYYWPYGAMQGTSMSSPFVAGAVALMLQADPNLSVDEVRSILQATARTDGFTGQTPNNEWGAGKIDCYGALQAAAGLSVIEKKGDPRLVSAYPNPTCESIIVDFEGELGSRADVLIRDVSGLIVRREAWLNPSENFGKTVDVSDLPDGAYVVEISAPGFSGSYKFIKK